MSLKITSLISIILLSVFLFAPSYVSAFGGEVNFDLMGTNCGVPGTTNDKCCRTTSDVVKVDLSVNSGVGPIDAGVNLLITPVRIPIEFFFNNVINTFTVKVNQIGTGMAEYLMRTLGKKTDNLFCIDGAEPQFTPTSCTCVLLGEKQLVTLRSFCLNIKNTGEQSQCSDCLIGDTAKNISPGIWTGIGCVRTDATSLIRDTVFRLGIGLAGAFALLCIMYGAFSMQMSQGNPEKLKKSQELITSCIMGLILIIFSVFILRFIGLDILGLPGFSR